MQKRRNTHMHAQLVIIRNHVATYRFGMDNLQMEVVYSLEPIAKRWRFEALGGVLRLAGRHFR
jgi:hypothetical protein